MPPESRVVRRAEHIRQLGQVRPANTTAVSIYTPARPNLMGMITAVVIANTTAGPPTLQDYRLFHDDDGTTYDQTTALVYDDPVDAAAATPQTYVIWPPNRSIEIGVSFGGNFAVRSDLADALTFTAYGYELEVA